MFLFLIIAILDTLRQKKNLVFKKQILFCYYMEHIATVRLIQEMKYYAAQLRQPVENSLVLLHLCHLKTLSL